MNDSAGHRVARPAAGRLPARMADVDRRREGRAEGRADDGARRRRRAARCAGCSCRPRRRRSPRCSSPRGSCRRRGEWRSPAAAPCRRDRRSAAEVERRHGDRDVAWPTRRHRARTCSRRSSAIAVPTSRAARPTGMPPGSFRLVKKPTRMMPSTGSPIQAASQICAGRPHRDEAQRDAGQRAKQRRTRRDLADERPDEGTDQHDHADDERPGQTGLPRPHRVAGATGRSAA